MWCICVWKCVCVWQGVNLHISRLTFDITSECKWVLNPTYPYHNRKACVQLIVTDKWLLMYIIGQGQRLPSSFMCTQHSNSKGSQLRKYLPLRLFSGVLLLSGLWWVCAPSPSRLHPKLLGVGCIKSSGPPCLTLTSLSHRTDLLPSLLPVAAGLSHCTMYCFACANKISVYTQPCQVSRSHVIPRHALA